MASLFRFGRLGQVYIGYHEDDRGCALDVWRKAGAWNLKWRGLQVIAERPKRDTAWALV